MAPVSKLLAENRRTIEVVGRATRSTSPNTSGLSVRHVFFPVQAPDYRRDHLRALTERVEVVNQNQIRIRERKPSS